MERRRDARGSAVVEFAVVVPMLMLVVLGVLQVGLALHVRSTITSAAAEGARVAAVSGGDTAAGVRRTRQALSATLAEGVVDSVVARRTASGGVATVDVEVRARLPLVGLLGPSTLVVHGHALAEA
ncbi:MAG: pilus assembly protein [Actinomycetales bacterium]|nr:pilus assembly protein [Actinomycetales bacterium]